MNHAFTLIPLAIEARGEVIASNVNEVRDLVRAALANINRNLTTDEEFGQAELDVKALKGAEEDFTSAKEKALKDAEALHNLFAAIDATVEEIRKPRLELEKLITKRKEEVKSELIEEALATFDIDPRDARNNFLSGLQTAIKGKRTLDSMRTALRVYATTQQAVITSNRKSIHTFENAHGQDMTMDRTELELKSNDYVTAELRRRFEAKKAADDRKRLEDEAAAAKAAESKARAEAEAARKAAEVGQTSLVNAAPAPLPGPPKIGSIPTGVRSAEPSNVVPINPNTAPQPETITEAQEWAEITATVKSAFALIKAHRERLIHDANKARIHQFGASVNECWKEANRMEVTA
jgi:hypothetical protein